VLIRVTDILLTHGVYRIGPGWACRAKPKWGAAPEMFPPTRRRSFTHSIPLCRRERCARVGDRPANQTNLERSEGSRG
jgi:hypothetical protein